MYHKYHTRGLVLESRGEGDGSVRMKVLTESFGLISARVQGGREGKSKLKAGSQTFSLTDFSFVNGKSGWKTVGAGAEKNFFETMKFSDEKIRVMDNVLKLTKRLVGEEEKNSPLFETIINFLNILEEAEHNKVAVLECFCLLRVLYLMGYMKDDPELALPLSLSPFGVADLESFYPKRAKMVSLINQSLRESQL